MCKYCEYTDSKHYGENMVDEQYSKDGKNLDYIPFEETKKYVDKIEVYYKVYKFLYE